MREHLIDFVLAIAKAGDLSLGDTVAITAIGTKMAIHHLPPGVLDHPERLIDLIGEPDQALLVLITDPARLPKEIKGWHETRTILAADYGLWLHDPIVTNLERWWRLGAGQTGLTGPGTPL